MICDIFSLTMDEQQNLNILLVDDEPIILDSITKFFPQYKITPFSNPNEALEKLKAHVFDIIIVDYRMPELTGLELLIQARKYGEYHYGILFTAYAEKDLLEEFINKELINKVIEKPLQLEQFEKDLEQAIKATLELKQKQREAQQYRYLYQHTLNDYLAQNSKLYLFQKSMQETMSVLPNAAQSEESIMLTGDTGTGKSVMASLIHSMSKRKELPFVKINCGAIPENLLESELFGHTKGAFTGANKDKPGKIELAQGGTLFLDEIGELKPELQTKLLHVIQEKTISRIGSNQEQKIDFRLITATNKNLASGIAANEFREDLFYRISVICFHLPPLKERKAELEPFIEHMFSEYAAQLARPKLKLSSAALTRLTHYTWPGNLRELENVLKRAIILAGTNVNVLDSKVFSYLDNQQNSSLDQLISDLANHFIAGELNFKTLENMLLLAVLAEFDGKITKAVEITGIDKNRFYRIKPQKDKT
ncbi:MAG: sigma-54 dependent transcriptional regulator [Spirochaetes bacterium]|nr:sigma-54 dependent transcriptional regulator [Spirochaetota bacterium]